MNRRLIASGIALVAVLGIAGCNDKATPTGGGAPAVATSPTATPTERLQAAAKRLSEESVKVKMEFGTLMSGSGQMDTKNKKGSFTMAMSAAGQSIDMQMVVDGNDAYLKMEGALASMVGDKWMRIDSSKIKNGQMSMFDSDQTQVMMSALTDVKADGPNSFTALMDPSKAGSVGKDAAALGKDVKIPFTAKLDDQGRLTTITMDMSAIAKGQEMPAGMELGKMVVTYSDFGAPVTVKVPAKSETQEMPASLSGMFGAKA